MTPSTRSQFLTSISVLVLLTVCLSTRAQVKVDVRDYKTSSGVALKTGGETITVSWPAGNAQRARIIFNLAGNQPLFKSIGLAEGKSFKEIAQNLDPAFILTVGKRDLVSQNGWNIFFDKVPLKPFQSYVLSLSKKSAAVRSQGSRTIVSIGDVSAPGFTGKLELTLYNGSPLFNVAAVVSTPVDSTAIVYDAGVISRGEGWKKISFADVNSRLQSATVNTTDTAVAEAVKYRTIIGTTFGGSLALFPAPHQYFYPLDEAFNLKFVWHGNAYRKMLNGYGLGIRQDLYGDRRFVPWFNSPPGTQQRLNFFCLLSDGDNEALTAVKKFTHNDNYAPIEGYKRMASHFHNEFIMSVVIANKPVPDTPSFITVFKQLGVDIVHLAEFHYTAHPRGPDSLRLKELAALFEQCRRLSSDTFLLLPGEEPNEFLGGHWLHFFPRPVYWIMSRKEGQPFQTQDPVYGTVYRITNAAEMLQLLQQEKGLAWTAHPRTKGSTGFPDKYKDEAFFKSDKFLGGAWKAMPADLSQPRLGKRVLDLMDDMNNWGVHKKMVSEADLFTVEPENEMYAHMNVNYLRLNKLPHFDEGWQPVLDALQGGKFFSTTGEVLIPSFTVNGKGSGETVTLNSKTAMVSFTLQWTFPLQFAELISGDGVNVYRHKIALDSTTAFGSKTFTLPVNLSNRKWVRLEVWDAAVNGAFTQTIWLE